MERTTCCVVGGGPAGMVLGLLLARAGVEVTVLEKHGDFLRDFRGDTVHASTLRLLDELGLGPAFAAIPHRLLTQMQVQTDGGTAPVADFGRVPGRHKHIAMVPQWDLLDLLADAAKAEPTFVLRMNTEVTGLVRDGGRVGGVRYRTADGATGELHTNLVVACDGRHSVVRAEAGLPSREFGVPLDVWWFRVPRHADDPEGGVARFGARHSVVMLDRGDYWQCAYLIFKGTDTRLRAEGIEPFRRQVGELLPWLAERMASVRSLDEVKLLDVRLDRLRKWFTDGLLCIGDAAHAMSPVGGVGINLAVQDAVAAARALAGPLRAGTVRQRDMARIQLRRWLPTAVIQGIQRGIHRAFLSRAMAEERGAPAPGRLPLPVLAARRFPVLQTIPAYLVGVGIIPEHAPSFARRP
ncbi:FAD-dependent oxidoreductase [Gandjariella thermophila]|uniref:Putative monooxygenase, FAD-binding protein n=1 Tax=Gandjariella thermophila TaxID=1931992 RepID=A0A4D4JFD6_9PSEU|nr:FAD-dependent oxidoreductase [Gandjariella thermophila]GDY32617.1 putative monooxygenase, FAD-binding protein [Gandjariella thermophila]